MNFALMISCKVEDKLASVERDATWDSAKETRAYEQCLKEVLEEDGRAWAEGNIRVGDYILLSQSPFTFFLSYAARYLFLFIAYLFLDGDGS